MKRNEQVDNFFNAKSFVIGFMVFVFLLLASAGGLTRADNYTVVGLHDYDTYECYNYSVVVDEMMDLQSQLILTNSRRSRVILTKKINKLRPSLNNREVLCLGRGVTPN